MCRANIRALGLRGVRAACAKATSFLAGPAFAPMDLVLIDPSYDFDEAGVAAMLEPLVRRRDPWLAPGAVVVLERSARSPKPVWPAELKRFGEKRYDKTRVWFAEPGGTGAPG